MLSDDELWLKPIKKNDSSEEDKRWDTSKRKNNSFTSSGTVESSLSSISWFLRQIYEELKAIRENIELLDKGKNLSNLSSSLDD